MSDEQTFERLLQQQLSNILQLVEILSAEKNILRQHSPSDLVDISQKKSDLLTAINNLDKQCKSLVDYKKYLSSEIYSDLLQRIEDSLTECKKLNKINGMIIDHSSLAIERMQNRLLENRSRSSITYNKKGKKRGGTLGKSIQALT